MTNIKTKVLEITNKALQERIEQETMQAKEKGCKSPGDLFTKMWIFIHGVACMTITGDYDLDEEETIKLLISTYQSCK